MGAIRAGGAIGAVGAVALLGACGGSAPGAGSVRGSAASCAAVTPAQQLEQARVVVTGEMLHGAAVRLGHRDVLVSPARMRVRRYLKGSGPRIVGVQTGVAGPGSFGEDGIEPAAGERWMIYTSSRASRTRLGSARAATGLSTRRLSLLGVQRWSRGERSHHVVPAWLNHPGEPQACHQQRGVRARSATMKPSALPPGPRDSSSRCCRCSRLPPAAKADSCAASSAWRLRRHVLALIDSNGVPGLLVAGAVM